MATKLAKTARSMLSGDTMHGFGSKETKRKVAQSQQFNVRQKPSVTGDPPAAYAKSWRLAQQPQSGE